MAVDYEQCELMRITDNLFAWYSKIKKDIVADLSDNPSKIVNELWGGYLVKDDYCISKMEGDGRIPALCTQCTCLSRISKDLKKDYITIETGIYTGTRLRIVKRSGNLSISLCETGRRCKWLHCDPITNEILVTMVYDAIDRSAPRLRTAFSCKGQVYMLLEESDMFTGCSSEGDFKSLLVQLTYLLRRLSGYEFTLGEASTASIMVSNNPVSTIIDDVHILGDKKYSLSMGSNSSISVSDTRISACLFSECCNEIQHKKIDSNLFIFKEDVIIDLIQRRRGGEKLYPCYLDLYCLVVSLLFNPMCEKYMLDSMRKYWDSMWVNTSHEKEVLRRIRLSRQYNKNGYISFSVAMTDILVGIPLSKDVLDTTWDTLK